MVQVQININVPQNDNNTIVVNLLEREDANDLEREFARNIQDMLQGVMEMVRDELPPGDVEITVVGEGRAACTDAAPRDTTGGAERREDMAFRPRMKRYERAGRWCEVGKLRRSFFDGVPCYEVDGRGDVQVYLTDIDPLFIEERRDGWTIGYRPADEGFDGHSARMAGMCAWT